jgi:hypothetical protein
MTIRQSVRFIRFRDQRSAALTFLADIEGDLSDKFVALRRSILLVHHANDQ